MLLMLSILITAFLLNLFLPWWSIAIPGLVFGYLYKFKKLHAFLWGFSALFLLWGIQALTIHFLNDGILSTRIANMMNAGSPYLIILATALIGGLISGLAALSGSIFRNAMALKK